MTKRRWVLAALLASVLILAAYVGLRPLSALSLLAETSATYPSPDGRYRVELLRLALPFAMPGGGSDAPGIVRLRDGNGRVLQAQWIEMVQQMTPPEWEPHSVYIRLFAEWPLPE